MKFYTLAGVMVMMLNLSTGVHAAMEEDGNSERGTIPAVSNHYKTLPSFYDFDQMPAEEVIKNAKRRFIMGTESSLLRWDLKAGTKLPAHFHINEQITRVERGTLIVYSQGQKYTVKAGQVMIFPPNVPHEFMAVTDTVIYETHTPARQDFINGEFEKNMANIGK